MSDLPAKAVHRAAIEAYRAGLWARPAVENGSKRPWAADGTWGVERLTAAVFKTLYPGRASIGIETGHDGLEAMDFDDRTSYDDVRGAAAEDAGLAALLDRIESGYCDDTPGGGVRWLYRCPQPGGNLKLARRPIPPDERTDAHERVKVLIETRGKGGFAIVAPSYGNTHPSGRPYVRRSGSFATIATITTDERSAIFGLLRSFDELPKPDQGRQPHATKSATGTRPGDDFCARTTWASILEPHGWRAGLRRGEVQHWTRPGKRFGTSATTNTHGSDLFYVFSSSTEFDTERGYSKFGVYAVLNHGGNFTEAARALAQQGYGDQNRKPASRGTLSTPPNGPSEDEDLIVVTVADAKIRTVEFAREGELAFGHLSVLAGAPGSGKTMIACQRAAEESHTGHVLYLTMEDGVEDTIKPRLRAAGADETRVHVVRGVGCGGKVSRAVAFGDLPLLDRLVTRFGVGGLFVDSIVDLVGEGVNDDRNRELRRELLPFVDWLEQRHLWCMGIAHTNKGTGPAITRVLGSMAWVAIPRIVLGVAPDPKDADHSYFFNIKNNIGRRTPTRGFRIRDLRVAWDEGTVDLSADQLWSQKLVESSTDTSAWLLEYLVKREADGVPSETVFSEGKSAGLTRKQLYSAKDKLGIVAKRRGGVGPDGRWYWMLPASADTKIPSARGAGNLRDLREDRPENGPNISKIPAPCTHTRACDEDDGEALL